MPPVNISPQFSTATILKPFNGFEKVYNGYEPDTHPIALPGQRDVRAGSPGYAPNLLAGVPVMIRTQVIIWLPRFLNDYGQDAPSYIYRLIWRLRSQDEQADDPQLKLTGHLGPLLKGFADEDSNDAPRFVIPAAVETVQYAANQRPYNNGGGGVIAAEIGTPGFTPVGSIAEDPINVNIASAQYKALNTQTSGDEKQDNYWVAPPSPSFKGTRLGNVDIVSQGVYPNLVGNTEPNAGFKGGPSYVPFTTVAKGDELLILMYRDESQNSGNHPWDFDDYDAGLSQFMSIKNNGILVMSGL